MSTVTLPDSVQLPDTWRYQFPKAKIFSPEDFLAAQMDAEERRLAWMIRLSRKDTRWREQMTAALDDAGLTACARAVRMCRQYGAGRGFPFCCRRLRFCITCLEQRLRRDLESDLIALTRAGYDGVLIARSARNRTPHEQDWGRQVVGYRRLRLPASNLFLWIIAARAPFTAPSRILGRCRKVALPKLPTIYREPEAELRALGPLPAMELGRRDWNLHYTRASGILRAKTKRPPREEIIARLR